MKQYYGVVGTEEMRNWIFQAASASFGGRVEILIGLRTPNHLPLYFSVNKDFTNIFLLALVCR